VQDEDRLRAELASKPPSTKTDEERVDGHEPFDEDVIHLIIIS
jgi:hypothetical protein